MERTELSLQMRLMGQMDKAIAEHGYVSGVFAAADEGEKEPDEEEL